MKVTYIGHATLLVEIAGVRVLTDPNFDSRLGWVLPRVAPAGLQPETLPALDALLLTHAHADHLSFKSLDRLSRNIPLYAPPEIARWLRGRGYANAEDAAPGRELRLGRGGRLVVRMAAAVHRGSRYGFDTWRGATNMYLLDDGVESCFFAGDTALREATHRLVEEHVHAAGRRLDLALLPIGHAPWWKPGFRRGHMTPRDALTLFDRLDARVFVPYHWGTFRHVTATAHAAIDRLRAALPAYARQASVRILEPGEWLELGRAGAIGNGL